MADASRLTVGDPLPALCDAHDLARLFGVSIPTIYRWADEGKLRRFEVRRPLGSKKWSGALLDEFRRGRGNPIVDLKRGAA